MPPRATPASCSDMKFFQGSHPQYFSKEDIQELLWSDAPAGGLLRMRQADKETVYFHGFKKSEESRLQAQVMAQMGLDLKKEQMGLAGHNWGRMAVHGKSVAFTVRCAVFSCKIHSFLHEVCTYVLLFSCDELYVVESRPTVVVRTCWRAAHMARYAVERQNESLPIPQTRLSHHTSASCRLHPCVFHPSFIVGTRVAQRELPLGYTEHQNLTAQHTGHTQDVL
jgi:hypothetical protein